MKPNIGVGEELAERWLSAGISGPGGLKTVLDRLEGSSSEFRRALSRCRCRVIAVAVLGSCHGIGVRLSVYCTCNVYKMVDSSRS